MVDRVNPFDEAIREALKGRKVTYNPGVGAFETVSTQEFLASGWNGEYSWPVHKDPIFTPLFTSIFGAGGFSFFGSTITYASIASAIATTAITMGINYLLTPKPPKPEDGRAPLTQSIPFRFWGIGEARVAGAFMLWEGVGSKLISVQALMAHPVDSIGQIYLHDDKVTVVGGVVQDNPMKPGRYNKARVKIWTRLGAVPETAYSDVVALLGSQGIWTNNHRGDGQASLAMICETPPSRDIQTVFPYGKPAASAVMKLAKVWDFRDPAQSPEDPSTWKWSKNSVLLLAWHECFSPFGTKRDYRKAILPVLDMWQEEADVCDEDVPLAIGGTEKRYECCGFDTTEKDPKSGTNAILATMDGWMCERGDGTLLVVAGKFREKYVATLTDADIVGHNIQHDVLFEEECNRFVPKFTYPATDYTTTDTDYFEDVPAQLTAGRVLPQEGNYPWVQQWRQARRLGKREFARIREKKRGSLDIRFTGINAIYAPWVRLHTPIRMPSLDGELISNRRSVLAIMNGGFQMTWIKMPVDIDAWDPATDEGEAPPIPISPENEPIPVPDIDSVAAIASSGTVYVRVAIADPQRGDLVPAVHYRVHDTGGGVPGAWVEQRFDGVVAASGLLVLNTNPVPTDLSLDVEVAFIGSDGTYGDWSITSTVISTVDSVPPAGVTGVSASGGSGQVAITWVSPNSANYRGANIRRNTVNNENTATLARTEYGAPSSPDAWTDTGLAAGTYYYWIRSINGSGVESTTAVTTGPKIVS